MKKWMGCFVLVSLSFIPLSCLHRTFEKGSSTLVSMADTLIGDSAMIHGYVHRLGMPDDYHHQGPFEVWVDQTNQKTIPDSMGYYSLKIQPGTYTIKCQDVGNKWSEILESYGPVIIGKNKKIYLNFIIGEVIE